MTVFFILMAIGSFLWLPYKMFTNTMKSRDGRSSRLLVCFKLLLAYLAILFGGICLFAGFYWVTLSSLLIATGIFLVTLPYYYFFIEVVCKMAYKIQGGRKKEIFDIFIESGGDPFWDFMPVPINNDSYVLRALGKTELERDDSGDYYHVSPNNGGGGLGGESVYNVGPYSGPAAPSGEPVNYHVEPDTHQSNDDMIECTIPVEPRSKD